MVQMPEYPEHEGRVQMRTDIAQMRADIAHGLALPQKQLSPKYFYDARGSALFDRITALPEYYLTRAETRLIRSFAQDWLARHGVRTLVELGAGSGEKTRLLLDALSAGAVYVPVDISSAYLSQITAELATAFPRISVVPALADIEHELRIPLEPERPLVVVFMGSTIGNFDEPTATALLGRAGALLEASDRLLIGVDLRKDRATLERAYNDAEGVTAAFNLNVLEVLNRELGANFDVERFAHRAHYDSHLGRIEMHLVSLRPQRVHVPGAGDIEFTAGESIRTEISCKYDRNTVEHMLAQAGLALDEWVTDPEGYALATAVVRA